MAIRLKVLLRKNGQTGSRQKQVSYWGVYPLSFKNVEKDRVVLHQVVLGSECGTVWTNCYGVDTGVLM